MELKELQCVYCNKGCGQKTFDSNRPFRGHFVCSECFEKKEEERKKETIEPIPA